MSYASYKNLGQTSQEKEEKEEFSEPKVSLVETVTSEEHRNELLRKNQVVVIDNYTTWCGPCKLIAPDYEDLAHYFSNAPCVLAKEDAEKEYEGAPPVTGVPCFHFYVKGKYIPRLTVTGGNVKQVKENLESLFKKEG
jgi:thioredoxin 1